MRALYLTSGILLSCALAACGGSTGTSNYNLPRPTAAPSSLPSSTTNVPVSSAGTAVNVVATSGYTASFTIPTGSTGSANASLGVAFSSTAPAGITPLARTVANRARPALIGTSPVVIGYFTATANGTVNLASNPAVSVSVPASAQIPTGQFYFAAVAVSSSTFLDAGVVDFTAAGSGYTAQFFGGGLPLALTNGETFVIALYETATSPITAYGASPVTATTPALSATNGLVGTTSGGPLTVTVAEPGCGHSFTAGSSSTAFATVAVNSGSYSCAAFPGSASLQQYSFTTLTVTVLPSQGGNATITVADSTDAFASMAFPVTVQAPGSSSFLYDTAGNSIEIFALPITSSTPVYTITLPGNIYPTSIALAPNGDLWYAQPNFGFSAPYTSTVGYCKPTSGGAPYTCANLLTNVASGINATATYLTVDQNENVYVGSNLNNGSGSGNGTDVVMYTFSGGALTNGTIVYKSPQADHQAYFAGIAGLAFDTTTNRLGIIDDSLQPGFTICALGANTSGGANSASTCTGSAAVFSSATVAPVVTFDSTLGFVSGYPQPQNPSSPPTSVSVASTQLTVNGNSFPAAVASGCGPVTSTQTTCAAAGVGSGDFPYSYFSYDMTYTSAFSGVNGLATDGNHNLYVATNAQLMFIGSPVVYPGLLEFSSSLHDLTPSNPTLAALPSGAIAIGSYTETAAIHRKR